MEIETQKMDQWCWAAVAVSVNHLYKPGSTLGQCDIAGLVLQKSCCPHAEACNEPQKLQDVLGPSGINLLSEVISSSISFEKVKKEGQEQRPVCVRIGWDDTNSGHFVIIDRVGSLQDGDEAVHVLDPLHADSWLRYSDFVSSYQSHGHWTGTFLLKDRR